MSFIQGVRVEMSGVPIDLEDLGGAQSRIDRLVAEGKGGDVHLCNSYTLTLAQKTPSLRSTLASASLNLPDGVPVVWAARLFGATSSARGVRGPDLFNAAMFGEWGSSHRHYLFGGSPDALGGILSRCDARGVRSRVVGAESPPFREMSQSEYSEVADRIRASGADLVWVGLGTPKQDLAAAHLKDLVPVVTLAVGAAFDFAGGTKPEAPQFLRHSGFEWVFRLVSEPRRLWKRYLVGSSAFAWEVIRRLAKSRVR